MQRDLRYEGTFSRGKRLDVLSIVWQHTMTTEVEPTTPVMGLVRAEKPKRQVVGFHCKVGVSTFLRVRSATS